MYWIFFGISTLFIVGSTSFIFWGILKRGKKQEPENELEIAFLKDQLRQLDKDKKNKITTEDDDLLSIAISRKILTLSRNDSQNKQTNEYSQKMNLLGSLCILFLCSGMSRNCRLWFCRKHET